MVENYQLESTYYAASTAGNIFKHWVLCPQLCGEQVLYVLQMRKQRLQEIYSFKFPLLSITRHFAWY